jgi:hypothetical protein
LFGLPWLSPAASARSQILARMSLGVIFLQSAMKALPPAVRVLAAQVDEPKES